MAALRHHDFIDAPRRDVQGAHQRVLRQPQRGHELLAQNLARVNRGAVASSSSFVWPSVVIDDFHVEGILAVCLRTDPSVWLQVFSLRCAY